MKKIKKYGNGGRVSPRTPSAREIEVTPVQATRADSLFLLNNNKIIEKYLKSGNYTWDQQSSHINKNDWEEIFRYKKDFFDKGIYEDPDKSKDIDKYYKKKIGNLIGTSDWLGNGGDDLGIPFQYLHPTIAPQMGGDLVSNDARKHPFIYSFKYDDLAITPWDMLNESQRKERVKRYGKTGTPLDDKTTSTSVSTPSAPSTPTHPTTPYMNKMPMRGMPNTNVSAEPIGVPNASVKDFGRFFLDSKGAWDITPQIPMKADGKEYTKEELNKMGYRYTTNRANYKPSTATINKYGGGGIVPTQRDNTDTKYTPKLKTQEKGKYLRDPSGDYVGSLLLGLSPLDTPVDIYSTINDLKSGRYDRAALSAAGAMLPKVSSLTLKTLYDDFGNWVASKQNSKKYKKGGVISNEFNGNTYDAMGMYGFGGDVLKFAATSPLLPLAASMIPGAGMIAGPAVSMAQQAAQQYAIPKKAEGGTTDQTLINVEGGELEVTPSGKIVKEFINKPKHPAYGMDQNGNTMSTVGNIIIPRVGKLGNENFKNGDDITRRSIIRALKYRQAKREGTSKFGFGGENKASIFKNVGPEISDPYYGENMSLIPSRRTDTNVQLDPQYTQYNDNTKGMQPLNIPFEETQSQQPQSQWSQLTGGQKLNYGLGQAATYGPALYNLGRSIFDKPYQAKMSDYQVNPDVKFDPLKGNAGRADMRNYYNSARTSIRNIGSGSAQLQGQIALANKLFQSTGKFNEDLENRNKLGIFEASRFNKGIQQNNSQMRYQVDMLNEQSRANQRNFGSTAVGQLSDVMQNQRNNNLMMGMLQSNYPGFNINKYTGVGSYSQPTTTTSSTTITPYNPNAVNNGMGFKTMWKNNFGR